MYLNTTRKKRLVTAVTLSIISSAAFAVPAFASSVGTVDHPMQYTSYTEDANGDIAQKRADETGESAYVALYHENFADAVYYAKGDQGGRTITIGNMTVEGIEGADSTTTTVGTAGGAANVQGLYSTNISNATIQVGNNMYALRGKISGILDRGADGGTGGTGSAGTAGAIATTGGSGDNGYAGGAGGAATASAIDITDGSNLTVTGTGSQVRSFISNQVSLEAIGGDGDTGGTGGAGGTGGNGGVFQATGYVTDASRNVWSSYYDGHYQGTNTARDGITGTAGAAGGTGGTGAAGGDGGSATATGMSFNSTTATTVTVSGINVSAEAGNGGTGGTGGQGGTGGIGQQGANGENNTATVFFPSYNAIEADWAPPAGEYPYSSFPDLSTSNTANGGTGGTGGAGGAGGAGGNGGTGGDGSTATAVGFAAVNSSLTASLGEVAVGAYGGNGGEGGQGGAGGQGGIGGAGGQGGTGNKITAYYTGYAASHYDSEEQAYVVTDKNHVLNDNENLQDISISQPQAASGATGATGANGTDGIQGNGGNGGSAYATGVTFTDSKVLLNVDTIEVYASAGSAGSGNDDGLNGELAEAVAYNQEGGTVVSTSDGDLSIMARANNASEYNEAIGIQLDNGAALSMTAAGDIRVHAAAVDTGTDASTCGILVTGSTLAMKSTDGDIIVTANGQDSSSNQSLSASGSTLTFDSGTNSTNFIGSAVLVNSTLNLKSNTNIQANTEGDPGNLVVPLSTVNLTNSLEALAIDNSLILSGTTIYFYDKDNAADKYNTTSAYRTITVGNRLLSDNSTNTLYMRTNAMGAYGGTAQTGDVINVGDTAAGNYDIRVFDQGMRNGYNNVAYDSNFIQVDADNTNTVDLITSTGHSPTTTGTTQTQYDNAVWNYTYDVATATTDGVTQLLGVSLNNLAASNAQYTARDANKAAAATAVTLFGSDETLMERMGDIRADEKNSGVWAKYNGGKASFDDASFKYNGIEIGIDQKAGDWQVGIMGSYDKGDSGLTSGDGTVKATAGALYGTWKNDKGHHVDLLAKVGKVKSETTSYGGTIPQALKGDFSSTAVGVSAEYGYRKELKNDVFVEPMVRASYIKLCSDDYTVTTRDGSMDVTNDGFNTFQLRGGVLIGKNLSNDSNVYAKLAVLHNFSGSVDTHISADGRTNYFSDDLSGTGFEYGIGTNYKFNKDSSLYADIERISGGSITKNWGLNVGYRYTF